MTEEKLKQIKKLGDDKRLPAYKTLIKDLNSKQDVKGLLACVKHLVKVEGEDTHGRTYITPDALLHFMSVIEDSDEKTNPNPLELEDMITLLTDVVAVIRTKDEEFPDGLMKAIKLLANCHEGLSEDGKDSKEHAKNAALALGSFNFEKGQCSAGYSDQVGWYIDTAELFLDAEMPGQASQQVKKAQRLVPEIAEKQDLVARFKLCYARCCDNERKFQDAAMRYLQLSQSTELKDDGKIMSALRCAVLCAVLAPAGPRRSRTLAMLYSDGRTHDLPSFPMLEKMFKGRIIRKDEVTKFSGQLQEHHKVKTKEGLSLLQQAVIEHNILAAAQIYRNIAIDQLGVLLGLDKDKAELLAWKMIEQGRMQAVIDQVEGIIEFQHAESGSSSLYTWDAQIQEACTQVNEVLESLAKKHPEYTK
jgi:COP9 signalosome complex subunit 4